MHRLPGNLPNAEFYLPSIPSTMGVEKASTGVDFFVRKKLKKVSGIFI
jgi:hypothetical protein